MTEFTPGELAAFRRYTPEQRAAWAWVAWEQRDPGAWRKGINHRRLSFTQPEWGPLQQRYGSLGEGLRTLGLVMGDTAALGFAAFTNPDGSVNQADAERLRKQFLIWRILRPEVREAYGRRVAARIFPSPSGGTRGCVRHPRGLRRARERGRLGVAGALTILSRR